VPPAPADSKFSREACAQTIEPLIQRLGVAPPAAGFPVAIKMNVDELVKLRQRDLPQNFFASELFPEQVNQERYFRRRDAFVFFSAASGTTSTELF
jgi:hypothetical protein